MQILEIDLIYVNTESLVKCVKMTLIQTIEEQMYASQESTHAIFMAFTLRY